MSKGLPRSLDRSDLAAITTLTDSSTGTSGGNTVAAVTDVATAANAIATLTAKLNELLSAVKK